ncbi:hypothetical protein O3P69_002485 [Scylla paramamosain]|uniref:Uncharacterized protein n=1 Tax=Scylla paramamosain TaxID=85552 RepID=A0AAW0ULG1_SCYPA
MLVKLIEKKEERGRGETCEEEGTQNETHGVSGQATHTVHRSPWHPVWTGMLSEPKDICALEAEGDTSCILFMLKGSY